MSNFEIENFKISRMPNRMCDMCDHEFNEIHVDRCDHCLMSYCKDCIPEGACIENCDIYFAIADRFCSRICRKESLCSTRGCMASFLARLKVYAQTPPSPEEKKSSEESNDVWPADYYAPPPNHSTNTTDSVESFQYE